MADFHVRLALEYFQARNRSDRHEGTLRGIVEHVGTTYALSTTEITATYEQALVGARRRGLLVALSEGR